MESWNLTSYVPPIYNQSTLQIENWFAFTNVYKSIIVKYPESEIFGLNHKLEKYHSKGN